MLALVSTKVHKLLNYRKNYRTFVFQNWKTDNGQDYVQTINKRLFSSGRQFCIRFQQYFRTMEVLFSWEHLHVDGLAEVKLIPCIFLMSYVTKLVACNERASYAAVNVDMRMAIYPIVYRCCLNIIGKVDGESML